jgi:hypothetical protein
MNLLKSFGIAIVLTIMAVGIISWIGLAIVMFAKLSYYSPLIFGLILSFIVGYLTIIIDNKYFRKKN